MKEVINQIRELNQEFIATYSEDDINSSPMLAVFLQLLNMIESQITVTGILSDKIDRISGGSGGKND